MILCIILFLLIILLNFNSKVKISIGNKTYSVHKYKDISISYKIAKIIHELNIKIDKLLLHLQKIDSQSKENQIDKLIKNYKKKITDLHPNVRSHVAYNLNKGSSIGLCIYKNDKIEDENTIMFVLLHELAHCMTKEYKHDEEFWSNFEFLLEEAIKIGIYEYQNFTDQHEEFCDMTIKHTPLIKFT